MGKTVIQPKQNDDLSPRERILLAARLLFSRHGIKGVSVDEIALSAHTNKMTLYRHFASRDLLVAAYLQRLADEADATWADIAAAHPGDPRAQLKAWLAQIGSHLAESGDRGCPLANAAIEIPELEHPARAVIERHKTHQGEQLLKLCREAGFADPARMADEIFLLLEGARVNVQSVGRCGPGGRFLEMSSRLIDSQPAVGIRKA
jgi:AcrR family transcriptional regulator